MSGNSFERFRHGADLTSPAKEPDTRGTLDSWQLFEPGDVLQRFFRHISLILVLLLIAAGVYVRSHDLLRRPEADRARRVCFNWLLPAFLLRHIWLCELDKQLYVVAAYSLVFHALWCAVSLRGASALEYGNRQLAGWTMLMSQGTMNSFLYPLLLRHKNFGEKSLACAVLWDLGGNMWICQFALFAIAAHYSPTAAERALGGDLDGSEGKGLHGLVDEEADDEEGESLLSEQASTPWPRRFEDLAASGAKGFEGRFASAWTSIAPCMPRSVLQDATRQPVLRGCLLGFALNCVSMPLPAVADYVLWVVGEPYKMVLYFLVGFYGDHRITSKDMSLLLKALGMRYVISAVIIGLTVTFLPLETVYRETIILVVLSPTSSYLIHLVAEHGYGESLLRLTVCGGFISTIISTFSQHLLMGVYDPD